VLRRCVKRRTRGDAPPLTSTRRLAALIRAARRRFYIKDKRRHANFDRDRIARYTIDIIKEDRIVLARLLSSMIRYLRYIAAVCILAVLAPVAGGAPRADGADRVYRYNFTRCGWDGSQPPKGLKIAWRYAREDWIVASSPTVHSGRVYCAATMLDITGSYGRLFCLDAKTGKPFWDIDTLGGRVLKGFFSSPAVTADGRHVVIGQGLHTSSNSDLICVKADTGKLHWRVRTPHHIEGSPAISGDMVVAGSGAREDADKGNKPRGDPGYVFAVRISDGKQLWRYALADPESSPAIGPDRTVYIGSTCNGKAVVALRSETDAELQQKKLPRLIWRTATPYPACGAVTLTGDMVVIGTGRGNFGQRDRRPVGAVMTLDRRTGKVLWRANMLDAMLAPIAADATKLICPVRNGLLIALDLRTGKKLWLRSINGIRPLLAGAVLAGPTIYAVSSTGLLVVLDARTGRITEKIPLNKPRRPGGRISISSPLVAQGRLYVGSETGGLLCLIGAKQPAPKKGS
jgi:outer membrane protein assembly factor BamB